MCPEKSNPLYIEQYKCQNLNESEQNDFIMDIQQLITLLRNNPFQQNLMIASAIYCGLNV